MTPPAFTPSAGAERSRRPGLAATLVLYTLARLGLLGLIAGLLALTGVPVLLALLVGLIMALPLSLVLFRGLRGQLDAAWTVTAQRRSQERAALRAGLRGEDHPAAPAGPTLSADQAQREPDGGGD